MSTDTYNLLLLQGLHGEAAVDMLEGTQGSARVSQQEDNSSGSCPQLEGQDQAQGFGTVGHRTQEQDTGSLPKIVLSPSGPKLG